MIALKITEIGTFINKLLKDGMCDHFLLQEAVITQAATYNIDGSFHPDYYEPEERETLHLEGLSYLPFSLLRPNCLKLMQGKKKPLFFKFVFLLSPENQEKTLSRSGTAFSTEDISGMYLHFTYKNDALICTTGISYRLFSLDKSLEQEWDRLVSVFLRQHGIIAEPVD
ncbi:DUF5721 family protein [uncultured Eubacterium sp.]|uniref:DUF5721 family protein n=1 Tax=uncultured Eubacterium sp. TaxID=165185 RepID=UPI0025EF9F1D|nr:DUF5721 family protein [uncultured Eubacterium sp.]